MKKFIHYILLLFCAVSVLGQQPRLNLTGDAKFPSAYDLQVDLVSGPNQTGGLWFPNEFNLNESFYLDILIDFGDFNAEGMAIVLSGEKPAPVGLGGAQLGVPAEESTFVVEFDLQQSGSKGDVSAQHIGFFKGGVTDHGNGNFLGYGNLSSPLNKNEVIRLIWMPVAQTFGIQRNNCTNSDIFYVDNIKNNIFGGDSTVYLGLTASTSGTLDTIQFLLHHNSLGLSDPVTICQGQEVKLVADYSPSHVWSSSAPYQTTSNSYEIIAKPLVSSYYKVTGSGPCGALVDSVLVTVKDSATANVGIQYDPNSNDATINLDLLGGSAPVDFNWILPNGSISYNASLYDVSPGDYQLSYNSGGGVCFSERKVTVVPTSVSKQDYFSPNGDGEDEGIEITVAGTSQIVNSAGQILNEVEQGDLWDGTDKSGTLLPSGVYLIIGEEAVQTITLLR